MALTELSTQAQYPRTASCARPMAVGEKRPGPVVIVGRQPLLRASIRQVGESLDYPGEMIECDSLAELAGLLAVDCRPEALVLFKEVGDSRFYPVLNRQLRRLTATPRVVLFSETLGNADWAAIDAGRLALFLPTKIDREVAARLLAPVFAGRAATESAERVRQLVTELQSLLMPDIQDLSATEQQVIAQLQRGLSNREIARRLGVHLHQIKKMLHEISAKLAVSGRLNIATLARRQAALSVPGTEKTVTGFGP